MLTKYQWKQSPSWARYHAFDGDGEGYWYKHEPMPSEFESYWVGGGNHEKNNIAYDGNNDFWQDTLEPRPFDTIPCPFCEIANLSIRFGLVKQVQCHQCGAEGPGADTEQAAWEAWAKRGS